MRQGARVGGALNARSCHHRAPGRCTGTCVHPWTASLPYAMYLRCTGTYECRGRQDARSDLPCRQKNPAVGEAGKWRLVFGQILELQWLQIITVLVGTAERHVDRRPLLVIVPASAWPMTLLITPVGEGPVNHKGLTRCGPLFGCHAQAFDNPGISGDSMVVFAKLR